MRVPLPPSLPTAFSTEQARAAGVTRSRLRAVDLEHPFRGAYLMRHRAPPEDDRGAVIERALAASAALSPNTFVSHVTAAVVWDLPLPFHVGPERPLDIGSIHPDRPARAAGVRGHRVQPGHVRVLRHPSTGLRIASPASTWAMLGGTLTHPYDLVALGEAAISDRVVARAEPLATIAQLEAAAFSGRRVGINALRAALPRIRPRVASRPETWTRLILVDAGVPEPEANLSVFDAAGGFLGCLDLAWPYARVAVEYEGGHHLFRREQWEADILRYERLAAAGWVVIRATRTDVFDHPQRLVARVRSALRGR